MRIVAPAERLPGEHRTALVPNGVKQLRGWGFDVHTDAHLGRQAGFLIEEYEAAGASISYDAEGLTAQADIVLRVRSPSLESIELLRANSVHISLLDPFRSPDLIAAMATRRVTGISLEMIPRTTRAQKMDVLSSQASLAGYAATITAAQRLRRVFPMMMTPAGTISPARVLVIGAGVAGLQAIATARRLGARVEAFDTRPTVAEEVRSLGAKFLEIDVGASEQTEQGYAKALTDAQLELQKQGMADAIARSDVLITTAQVFGRSAPRIVTRAMIESMRVDSVVIDLAVESGGNVEGSIAEETIDINGVQVLGMGNLPSQVATHASEMFSSNLVQFIGAYRASDQPSLELLLDDNIIESCMVTKDGAVLTGTKT